MPKSLIYILSDASCDVSVFALQFNQESFQVKSFVQLHELVAAVIDQSPKALFLLDPKPDSQDLSSLGELPLSKLSEFLILKLSPGDDQSSMSYLFAPYILTKLLDTEVKERQLSFYTWSTMPLLRSKYPIEKPHLMTDIRTTEGFLLPDLTNLQNEALIDITQQMDEYERRLRNAFYCTRLELLQRQSTRSRTLENLLPTCLNVTKKILQEETLKATKQLDFNLIIEDELCFINDHHFERLLQELMNNAVHFAHPYGRIELAWFLSGFDAHFIIYNSGQGMTPECLENLRKTFTEDFPVRYNAQWGFKIVSKIASLYNASIEISSEPQEYFAIEIIFPNVTINHPSVRKSVTTGIPLTEPTG